MFSYGYKSTVTRKWRQPAISKKVTPAEQSNATKSKKPQSKEERRAGRKEVHWKAQNERKTPEGKKNRPRLYRINKKRSRSQKRELAKIKKQCKDKGMTVSKNGTVCRFENKCIEGFRHDKEGNCYAKNFLVQVKEALKQTKKVKGGGKSMISDL